MSKSINYNNLSVTDCLSVKEKDMGGYFLLTIECRRYIGIIDRRATIQISGVDESGETYNLE